MSSESSLKIGCCSLENNADFKCSLVVQSVAKRARDICSGLTASRIGGELASLSIQVSVLVIWALRALEQFLWAGHLRVHLLNGGRVWEPAQPGQLGPTGSSQTRLGWIWRRIWEENLALNVPGIYWPGHVTYALQIALNPHVDLRMVREAVFATFVVCLE